MISKEKGDFVVTTTMSKANQITVPSVVRKMMGLEPGDEVEFEEGENGFLLKKALTKEEKIRRAFARLDEIREQEFSHMTPEQKKLVEMAKGWTVNQYHEYIDNLPETKEYIRRKYGVKVA